MPLFPYIFRIIVCFIIFVVSLIASIKIENKKETKGQVALFAFILFIVAVSCAGTFYSIIDLIFKNLY
ncbi:MAG: hypothetical protein HUJ68_06690 [Clostridia bacterium]|nr:hypothetical protein [Clostridia bacterium]